MSDDATQENDRANEWDSPKLQVDVWHKYENVAMHFNDLLMRFRLQALGGLVAVGSVAGLLTTKADGKHWFLLPWLLGFLLFAWLALWVLDATYYRRLLRGAVKELVAYEKRTARIQLSTVIEDEVRRGWFDGNRASDIFYLMISVALLGLTVISAKS